MVLEELTFVRDLHYSMHSQVRYKFKCFVWNIWWPVNYNKMSTPKRNWKCKHKKKRGNTSIYLKFPEEGSVGPKMCWITKHIFCLPHRFPPLISSSINCINDVVDNFLPHIFLQRSQSGACGSPSPHFILTATLWGELLRLKDVTLPVSSSVSKDLNPHLQDPSMIFLVLWELDNWQYKQSRRGTL